MKRFSCWTGLFCLATIAMALGGPVGRWGIGFALLYVVAFVALTGMVGSFPKNFARRRAVVCICLFGLLLRGAFAGFPVSTDVYRYIWEGAIQIWGFNPYALAPDNPALAPLASGTLAPVWQAINHKDFSACYPPLAILVFRLLAAIQPEPWFFKLVMAAADAAVLIPLAAMFRRYGAPPSRLLWYAANPLLLVFVAGEGHLDSLMVLMLVTGCALVGRGRAGWGFFAIGCAAMLKYFAWLAVPFLLRKGNFKMAWATLIPVLFYLPYTGADRFESLSTFATRLHYNDALTAVLRLVAGPAALPLATLILTVALMVVFATVHDPQRSAFLAFGCLLVCLPTLHPWYLALAAPFAALFASTPWLYLQAAMVFTFPVLMAEYATGNFQEIYWLKIVAYVPFYLLLLFGIRRRGVRPCRPWPAPQTLSVVIPTLNEEENISDCLLRINSISEVSQAIVCDGGSWDATCSKVAQAGATLVSGPKGRGRQIREGIRHATGDVILVLHADARLDPAAPGRVLNRLRCDGSVAGGAMAMEFQGTGWKKVLIAGLNNLRARLTGIAFGDQGQFFRKDALTPAGGFPDLMLMEDVELSLRLKEAGRCIFLPKGITVSGRRWEKRPMGANIITVVRLFSRYLVERRLGVAGRTTNEYYARYYEDAPLPPGK